MALSADALTTVATVLDELGIKDRDCDITTRRRVERLIDAASSFVEGLCSRGLACRTVVEKKRSVGSVRLFLDRTPVVSIASIVIDGDVVDVDTYEVEDAALGEVFRRGGWPSTAQLQPGLTYHEAPGTEEPSIVVTYDGGFVTPHQVDLGTYATRTLPADLEDVVVRLVVSRWWGRGADQRVTSESVMSASVTYSSSALSADDAAVLAKYSTIGNA